MKNLHKISIVATILVIQIVTVISVVYLSQQIALIRIEINQTKGDLLLDKLDTQSQIKTLTENLADTQKSLTDQFNVLKAETSSDFSGIISDVAKSVVTIRTDVAQGSGFIITSDGYAVTNVHVLNQGRYIEAITYENKKYDAQLVGYDPDADIAVIKINGNFERLKFGDSDNVRIGEKVIAIGNPLGLSFSVTEGIVSGVHREGPQGLNVYLQTDTPLNPGNSGGPLIDTNGKVIGINSLKIKESENVGFAIESDYAVETINKILNQTIITI